MLQRHRPHALLPRIHRPLQLRLADRRTRRSEEEVRRRGRAQLEVEGAVGTDGYAGGDGDADGHVRGSGVELLREREEVSVGELWVRGNNRHATRKEGLD